MKENIESEFSKYTLDELENFRDENGFIDLSKAGVVLTDKSREKIGNQNRIKNWVNFNGVKCLIKGENILDNERNYGIYAELIVEEMGKSLGIDMAHYDLIKILDENNKYVYGVLSVSMLNDGECLLSLRDIIGDEEENSTFVDTTSYDFTINKLNDNLPLYKLSKEEVFDVIKELKKRMAFSLLVLETDKHTENYSFLKSDNSKLRLSPNYDSEASLLLDNDISVVSMLLDDYIALKKTTTSIAQPRIGNVRKVEEGGFNSLWKDTLEDLIEDDDVYDYCSVVLNCNIDMEKIFENIEKRIKAKLPEQVKLLSKYAYECRKKEFDEIVLGEVEDDDMQKLLKKLLNKGLGN